jgi:tetratricopeptide (TPR) repeat protein
MLNFNRVELSSDYTVELEKGISLFYSGDWEKADSTFSSLITKDSKAPEAYFFQSMIPFWKYFFAGQATIDAKQFLKLSEKAIQISESYFESNKKDTSIVLLLSGLYGYRALVSADQGEYLTAAKSGLSGFDFTKKILNMDENLTEAKIGRGIYYYMSGSVPDNGKWLVKLFGMNGTKEQGFAELEIAAQTESRVHVDANLILSYLYLKENKPYQAFKTSQRLTKLYPENPIFLFLHAESLEKIGKNDDAVDFYNQVLEKDDIDLVELNVRAKQRTTELTQNKHQSMGTR